MTDPFRAVPSSTRGRWAIVALLLIVVIAACIWLTLRGQQRPAWLGGGPATATLAGSVAPRGADPPATALASAIDPATLESRQAALAAQLASLEAREATVAATAAAAGGQAGRAEGILVAFAARRMLDRGQPLGYLEDQLRLRFAATQGRAVAIVIQAARRPVTIEDLREGLDAIAPDLASGAGTDGWFVSLRREIGNLIVLRKAGVPSPLPADRLARSRRLLEAGQVEAARAEVMRLPGVNDASNWVDAAQRYVLARHALDTLESAAILGQSASPPAPAG